MMTGRAMTESHRIRMVRLMVLILLGAVRLNDKSFIHGVDLRTDVILIYCQQPERLLGLLEFLRRRDGITLRSVGS